MGCNVDLGTTDALREHLREPILEDQSVSSRICQLRVQDILAAVTNIEQRTAGMTFEQFVADETIVKSILYDFIIISETIEHS